VLRGDPVPGAGTEALRELVVPSDEALASCAERWLQAPVEAKQARRACDPDKQASVHCVWLPLAPELEAALGTCGPTVEAAVRRAAAHGASCGPATYGGGERLDDGLIFLRVMSLHQAHTLVLEASGRAREALELAVDGALVALDLSRGGGSWLDTAFTMAVVQQQATLVAQLARDPSLSGEDLEVVRAEVERLIAAVPPVQDTLIADLTHLVQHGVRAYLRDDAAMLIEDFSPKSDEEALFGFRATRVTIDLVTARCPPRTASATCAVALSTVDAPLSVDPHVMVTHAALPGIADMVRKFARMVALLHALHVELTIGARVAREGACPADGGAGWPEVAAALAAPGLGLPLALARGGADGEWHVVLPRGLGAEPRATPRILSRFACRDGRLISAPPPASMR
jgi:hypothetical protein